MEQMKILCQVGYNKGHNSLSFVIVVNGGEGLGVAINAKGGDCWKIWVIVVIDVKGVHE